MSDYRTILAASVSSAIDASEGAVRDGQAAARELAVTEEFIKSRTSDLVGAMLDCDPTAVDTLRVLAIGLKALRELHNHLTQAVTAGQAAALRLHEESTRGDAL